MCGEKYVVTAGPEGYMASSAALKGIQLPKVGEALVEGEVVSESKAMELVAQKLLTARNPFIFPGPLVLWNWNDEVEHEAALIKELAVASNARIIPMPDYRPKYPKINPEVEINPNHPNITIWHNQIDVCVFIGLHCHYANVALKLIRGGTDCYTIALCGKAGHEDAMISLRDLSLDTLRKLIATVNKMKSVSA